MTSLRFPLAVALAAALVAAFPVLDLSAGDRPEEPETPAVLAPTDEERGKINAAIAQVESLKGEEEIELQKNILVELDELGHEEFHPFIRDCMKSKDPVVQTLAIRAAASHEMKEFEKTILKLVKGKPRKRKSKGSKEDAGPALVAAAIDYLARMDVGGAEKQVLEVHFQKIFLKEQSIRAKWAPDMMRASIHYLGKMKYRRSVETFIEQLPEPVPADPNSGTNPPATYWEGRYKLWQASEGWIRWALKEITGQEYRTHREWKAWFSKFGKKYSK